MATTLKVLGQAYPAATTETTLYTVPGATTAVVSSLVVCNTGAVAITFRVSVSVGGGATQNKDYVYYDVTLGASDTFMATAGLSLGAGDIVRVYSSLATGAFNLFGSEVS